jgi:predicted DNA-binding transcriptional regulator YafY
MGVRVLLGQKSPKGGGRVSQTERIFYILEVLRGDNQITAKQTADHFEVSTRTVKRDFEYIRDRLDYNLIWSSKDCCYSLTREDLEKIRLRGEQELLFYSLVMGFCRNRKLMPLVSRSIEEHLSDLLPPKYRELSQHISYDLFDYPEPPAPFFSLILKAISQGESMEMAYTSLMGKTSVRKVEPLHLKNWNGQWYLAAWCHTRREIRLFLLSRIDSLDLTGEKISVPAGGRACERENEQRIWDNE